MSGGTLMADDRVPGDETSRLGRSWQPVLERRLNFRTVRRSRFVGLMKVMLPVLAVALFGVVLAWPQIVRRADGFRISFASVEEQDGSLTMEKARYRGTDAKGQPFLVTADSAIQATGDAKQIVLDQVTADITLNGGTWITLQSRTGLYEQEMQRLTLEGNVNLFTDHGYEFHGHLAEIDLREGTIASDQKVWGQGPLGRLQANGMRVAEKGNRILFTGGVKTTLHVKGPKGEAKAATGGAAPVKAAPAKSTAAKSPKTAQKNVQNKAKQ